MNRTLLFALVWGISNLAVTSSVWAWTPFFVKGTCQQNGGSCRSTVGNRGGGGACCDPASGAVTQCVQDNPCQGSYRYHWPANKLPLQWSFNPNGMLGKGSYANMKEADVVNELKKAWAAWSSPPCTSFKSSYQGTTTDPVDYFDDKLVIYLATTQEWAQLGISTSALAFSSPRPNSRGEIQDADIIVGPGVPWALPPVPASGLDLTEALSHEMGHSLGFGHSPLRTALMYFSIRGQGPLFKGLGPDDRDGICTLYPQSNVCTSAADCISTCASCTGGKCSPSNPAQAKDCQPCAKDADCGTGRRCIPTASGSACMPLCQSGCCPSGMRCRDISNQKVCVPMTSQCPDVSCKSDQDCGDGVCDNASGICKSKTPYDYKACSKTCLRNTDCSGGAQCVAFANGFQRCIYPCISDQFCPKGFACRKRGTQSLCMPFDESFCPCQANSDCAASQICRNQICQPSSGGKEGDSCTDAAPCQNGLECFALTVGNKCVRPCAKAACPTGQDCVAFNLNRRICAGKATGEAGDPCDTLFDRCKSGLSCFRFRAGDKGTCARRCTSSSECVEGGTCQSLGGATSVCTCSGNVCKDGRQCKNVGSSTSICLCETPPCTNKCGNGTCDPGENCTSCASDCPCRVPTVCRADQCVVTTTCGNGTCDPGENCGACPKDCPCPDGQECRTNSCQPPSAKCGDGTCDAMEGESCNNCEADCKCGMGQICLSGSCQTNTNPNCGNGTCEPNENCGTCPTDCPCSQSQACQNNVCQAKPCGNGICDSDKGENCTSCPSDCRCAPGTACQAGGCQAIQACGNGTCDLATENCQTCPQDCACINGQVCESGNCRPGPPPCGNGTCEDNENCGTCPQDCACSANASCQNNTCIADSPTGVGRCGDGVCTVSEGENCDTCKQDCGCKSGKVCYQAVCTDPNILCQPRHQVLNCDAQGNNCKLTCTSLGGCGCQANTNDPLSPFFPLFLLGLLFLRRLRSA